MIFLFSRHLRRNAALCGSLSLIAGCVTKTDNPPRHVLRLMTGIPGGGYYSLSQALTMAYARMLPTVDFKLLQGSGSIGTIEAIQRGDVDIGFAFADAAYLAFIGRLHDGSAPFDRLRGISVLQVTPLQLVVRTGIRSIIDLRGRRVGLGPASSGTSLTAGIVLAAFGMGPGAIRPESLPFDDAAIRLAHGQLDAMFVGVSYPAEPVSTATRMLQRCLR